jgi:hypothetical protein
MRVKGAFPKGINILKSPLSMEALKIQAKKYKPHSFKKRISVNIIVSLGEIMTDLESFNDMADERVLDLDSVVGSLSDIKYSVVGYLPVMNKDGTTNYDGYCRRGAVIINVDAEVFDIIQEEE